MHPRHKRLSLASTPGAPEAEDTMRPTFREDGREDSGENLEPRRRAPSEETKRPKRASLPAARAAPLPTHEAASSYEFIRGTDEAITFIA